MVEHNCLSILSRILLTRPNASDMLTGRELNDLKAICALLHPLNILLGTFK